jgi:hypothetical protein
MKLQRTYKPDDYHKILAEQFKPIAQTGFPISCDTLNLICNHFNQLDKTDRKKVNTYLTKINEFMNDKANLRKILDNLELARFKKELKIIEIFQRNNI